MDEDEYETDAETYLLKTDAIPSGINYADVLQLGLHPLKGLFVGLAGATDRLHQLLALHSGYIDEKKSQKAAHKDLERMLNG